MQASDTLERIRREIDARLHQLRPQVQEYATLEEAVRLLGNSRSRTTVGNGPTRRGRARGSSPAGSRRSTSRAPSPAATRSSGARNPMGANQAAILNVLGERATPNAPLTARQVADATGLAPPTVHRALRGLTKRRVVRLIMQPTGRRSYVLASTGRSSSP
jgi:hypothetical protein